MTPDIDYGSSALERVKKLEAEIEQLGAALVRERKIAYAEIERLRAALQNLMNDVLEYERINNLAPNPGKQDCWQSVTEARRALEPKP